MRSSASLGASPQPSKSKASECGTASPLGGQEGEQHTADYLKELVKSWHVQRPVGIYSVCSAHPWVLEAAMEQAIADNSPLLIEATSNQVNHLGGYTGMTPADFRRLVEEIAQKTGFKTEGLILGGDHLGPNPWQRQPAEQAMREAERMVVAFAQAGYTKIHLDASMACGDEQGPLTDEIIANRAATLCAAAEQACGSRKPMYVIGTEVPVPGGATESLSHLEPTRREAAAKTLEVHRRVFAEKGLSAALPRVIALVVQPGVEFNHLNVVDYDPALAVHLTQWLKKESGFIYEAHSTDYQRPQAYRDLVRDGFAILKVGPALTFAMREALEALERIEIELTPAEKRSRLSETMEKLMLEDPRHWEHHYHGDEQTKRLLRRYSYSDRVRYYWATPQADQAVQTLMRNLREMTIPETMLSAFLPEAYRAVRAGELASDPLAIVKYRIRSVLEPYAAACRQ
jgi:D-tagatose-1,6-bisphosphate aldolase subunit GatZ/KbaZ